MLIPLWMIRLPARFGVLAATLVVAQSTIAAETTWDQRLAETCSRRLTEIRQQLAQIPAQLATLPSIPIDDQGGTGGFACIHPTPSPPHNGQYAIETRWASNRPINLVALVPARRYDAKGLDALYGMPDQFTVELLDEKGDVTARIAHEKNARSHPVRRGHPFVYQLNPPVTAAGLRICAEHLLPDPENANNHVHAWAEVFAFDGDRNIARGATVTATGGSPPPAPWHWKPEFLVDEQTPLGLPEIPDSQHHNVGWLSNGRNNANESVSLTVDLGNLTKIDGVRLLPARRPTSDLPSGFGFPRQLAIEVSETGDAESWTSVTTRDQPNPGHNPVQLGFTATTARFVRIKATQLWKGYESYPAFFALSEVEVLDHANNLATGKLVRSSDGTLNIIGPGGYYWSTAALDDGFGPDGRLVSTREWLIKLDQHLQLESQRHKLLLESTHLVTQWRNGGLVLFILLGLAGAFVIIVLPIRFRIHARNELMKVRERIAGDLHDEVGSNLGSIQMFADLAEGRSGPSDDLKRIQRIASETVSAVRDIVWLLRPSGDHRIGAVEHLRETSSIMLESLKWGFHANETSWDIELPEESNRHLFLFFREALHNILRHAHANHVEITIETNDKQFRLTIADDGCGIAADRLDRPATLRALRQRADALAADFAVVSTPDHGTSITLSVPLGRKTLRKSSANS